jgi:hypothetical protein
MKHAFPLDELNPLHCNGRGPDYENPDNININDVLGDYSLTLVDVLDTLALIGNSSGKQGCTGSYTLEIWPANISDIDTSGKIHEKGSRSERRRQNLNKKEAKGYSGLMELARPLWNAILKV